VRHAWHADAVPILLAGLLVTLPVMLVLAAAPILAGVSLLSRLTGTRAAPAKPTPAERLLRRPLSTGALVAWLVIPLLVIGLWATADALTEDGGQPTLKAGGVPGLWKTSRGAMVIFAADGHFTETNLPNPPHDASFAFPNVPRSATGTWKLEGPAPGFQDVELTFSPSTALDLTVTWEPATDRHGYFVLEPYAGFAADSDPAYQLIRQGGA
jgi:hypothetical protein